MIQFVDSVSTTAALRLNLHDDQVWRVLGAGTDLSPPPLRRAVAGSLLADGQQIPSSAYDNRLITLTLQMQGAPTDEAAATELQALLRELNRATNVLKWQPGTTTPVYFRTFRADASAVTWTPTTKVAVVRIVAEPFAYGAEELYGNITIGGDPASGGIFADITGIKGDVETPLILVAPSSPGSPALARQAVFALRRSPNSFNLALAEQAEAMTLGTDATTQTVAGYSGGTPNCVRISFTTATLVVRLSGSFPVTGVSPPNVEFRGRYRVFARVKKSIAGDPVTVQLKYGNVSGTVANTAVTLPANTNTQIVDLGTIVCPFGPDPVTAGYSGVELTSMNTFIEFYASRASGTTNLEVDYFAFMPAHDTFTIVNYPSYGGSGLNARPIWDGPNEVVYLGTAGANTGVRTTDAAPLQGAGSIKVSPAVNNRIYGLAQVTPGQVTDLNGVQYEVRYYPRYLYVRPAAT